MTAIGGCNTGPESLQWKEQHTAVASHHFLFLSIWQRSNGCWFSSTSIDSEIGRLSSGQVHVSALQGEGKEVCEHICKQASGGCFHLMARLRGVRDAATRNRGSGVCSARRVSKALELSSMAQGLHQPAASQDSGGPNGSQRLISRAAKMEGTLIDPGWTMFRVVMGTCEPPAAVQQSAQLSECQDTVLLTERLSTSR